MYINYTFLIFYIYYIVIISNFTLKYIYIYINIYIYIYISLQLSKNGTPCPQISSYFYFYFYIIILYILYILRLFIIVNHRTLESLVVIENMCPNLFFFILMDALHDMRVCTLRMLCLCRCIGVRSKTATVYCG